MSEWYERAYLGGAPVQVDGFPRPLYPPDAANRGKKPSEDGPDVIAYKRGLCRAGRWGDWDPSKWDDTYSNGFSHGKGPNLKDTGISGFQRQMDVDDTGWLGATTFNMMRYALVSDPSSPNFKEPIFDSVCVQNINKAYKQFGGHEPDTTKGTLRQAALALAISQIGVKESPADTNRVKYTDWYGLVGPWCAMFMAWCFEMNSKGQSPSFIKGERYAYVPFLVSDARLGKFGLFTVSPDQVIPGDLCCYDWQRDGQYDHIGVFEQWIMGAGDFNAIEGNTSVSNDSNGGAVMRRRRNASQQGTVFVRVTEP